MSGLMLHQQMQQVILILIIQMQIKMLAVYKVYTIMFNMNMAELQEKILQKMGIQRIF